MVEGRPINSIQATQIALQHRPGTVRTLSSRLSSPERYRSPIRHRPLSPNKLDVADAMSDDKSKLLLALAAKERALSELRERRKELDLQISTAEQEVALAKKQLSSSTSPLKSMGNPSNNGTTRDILQKDRELETLQHLADGVSAIWKDVVQATIGDHAAT